MRKILIIGATSAIAADLTVRGCPKVDTYIMDVNDFDSHTLMLDAAEHVMNVLDTVLIAHGTLSD